MADRIRELPTDSSNPSRTEAAAINMLFPQKRNPMSPMRPPPPPPPLEDFKSKSSSPKNAKKTWLQEFSKALFGALLFIILSQPFVVLAIEKYVPQASSPFLSVMLRAVAFIVIFYAYEKLWAK